MQSVTLNSYARSARKSPFTYEQSLEDHDEKIKVIFEAIRQLMAPPEKKKNKIGFEIKEGGIKYGTRARRR